MIDFNYKDWKLKPEDRDRIAETLRNTGLFSEEQIQKQIDKSVKKANKQWQPLFDFQRYMGLFAQKSELETEGPQ